jgi:hypothetical protein
LKALSHGKWHEHVIVKDDLKKGMICAENEVNKSNVVASNLI